jgi:hypothetical protein
MASDRAGGLCEVVEVARQPILGETFYSVVGQG